MFPARLTACKGPTAGSRALRLRGPRAATIPEVLASAAALAVAAAVVLPALAQVGHSVPLHTSWSNLRTLHTALSCYAADWSDRQYTAVPDDLGVVSGSCGAYMNTIGCYPPAFAGIGCDGLYWAFWGGCETMPGSCGPNTSATRPLVWNPQLPFGIYRVPQVKPVHDYLNGRFYDPVFYSPLDHKPFDAASPAFDVDCEFVEDVGTVPSSYAFSPAAMYHPQVLRKPSEGGFQHPESFDEGFASPAVPQARFPALKTWMMELNWVRRPPAECNADFDNPLGGYSPACDPYLYNHGADAEPLALFFDGSVELLRSGDVFEDDAQVLKQTGGVDGLWSRDTPLGETGYFGEFSVDGILVSHHILTTGGILGRDRLGDGPGGGP